MAEPQEPSETVVRAWTRLMRAQRRVLGRVEADLKAAGLPSLGWYDALLELRRAGEAGLRPMELEERLLLAQHNISRLVDRLEAAGTLARCPCPEDRRGHRLTLTQAGAELLERMWPIYRGAIQQHLGARLGGDGNAARLVELLERLE